MQQVRAIAWKVVGEMLGWDIGRPASGTPSVSTFLRGDWTWATPPAGTGTGGGAPTDAEYIVKTANSSLSAERVLTDTATVTWDYTTAGQAKASVPNLSGTNTGDQSLAGLGGVSTSRTVNGHALSADVTVTKGDVGLGNVDNTSDTAKPISTATQTALNAKAASSHTHAASEMSDSTATGRAVLTAASQAAARSAIGAGTSSFDGAYGSLSSIPLTFAPAAHSHPQSDITNLVADLAAKVPGTRTVAGKALSSDVTLAKADVGLGSVDNTADASKPVSTATQTALDAKAPNASYRTILDCTGSHTAARVAATYAFAHGDPLIISGTGTLYPANTVYIAAADYPSSGGLAPKLRIRVQLYTNDVAPTGTYTFGLHPITRPATSGGAGLCIYTIGTVVSGSNGAAFSAPGADGLHQAVGADFALPADGHYVIGMVQTGTVAASAHMHVSAQLQMRNA